jgi:PKD repeat protein
MRMKITMVLVIELLIAYMPLTAASYSESQNQSTLQMFIQPSKIEGTKLGETFNVSVNIQNVYASERLVGLQFRVQYNKTLLQAIDAYEGTFLSQFHNRPEPPYTYFIKYIEDDPIYGPNVLIGILLLPNDNGQWTSFPEGNGTLALIAFKVIYRPVQPDTATCPLNLADTMIVDDSLQEIPHETAGATYEAMPLPIPSLNVEPPTYTASLIGEEFSINISIKNLDVDWRLTGVQFRVQYNADVLQALSVVEGPFLGQFNNTAEPPYTYLISYIEKDTIYGPNVLVGILLIPNATGNWTNFPHGNGTLATITFKAIKQTAEPQPPISAALTLNDTMLVNDTINEISHTTFSGHYEIKPLSFNYEPATPFAGRSVLLKAPEANFSGTYCWNFGDGTSSNTTEPTVGHIYTLQGEYNVTLYVVADGLTSPSITKTITIWPAQPTMDVTVDAGSIYFRGGIAEFNILTSINGEAVNATKIEAHLYHNGTLYADLSGLVRQAATGFYVVTYNIPEDAETGTYTLVVKTECYNAKGVSIKSFQISLTPTAQIIAIVAKAFGSAPGSPNWNPIADVNRDGKVDMKDIIPIARSFGKDSYSKAEDIT